MTAAEFETELEQAAAALAAGYSRRGADGLSGAGESELALELEEAALEIAAPRCPPDRPDTVRGFTRYSNNPNLLPAAEQRKLAAIAIEVVSSHGTPTPVVEVRITGHADLDPARERRQPGFIQAMSQSRAETVSRDLQSRVGPGVAPSIAWTTVGAGTSALAVPDPRTEAERACNRRVVIALVRGPVPPPPPPPPPPTTPTVVCPPPLTAPGTTAPIPGQITSIVRLVNSLLSGLPLVGRMGIVFPTSARFLDASEQAEANRVLGGGLDYTRILLADGLGFFGRQFTVAVPLAGGWFVVMLLGDLCSWTARPRPTTLIPGTSTLLPGTGTLIHELTHAWQSQHHGSDPQAFMWNSVRCQSAAFADVPIAKSAAAAAATAAAVRSGVIDARRLAAIGATAFAAEDVSAYAYIPGGGRSLRNYAAEQVAQQVEDAYLASPVPTPPGIATILPALGPGVPSADNATSLTVIGFERKSPPGVVFR